MRLGEHRHAVGSYLVGHVAVGGDSVGASYYKVNFPFSHYMGGHVVADQGHIDARIHQFPCCEPGALQQGACLVGKDADFLVLRVCDENGGKRRAHAAGGQCARVAVGEHGLAGTNQLCSMFSDLPAEFPVFFMNPDRLLFKSGPDAFR